jgi:multidrug efflux pump subunit AcrA (membrane-fusion protein)
LSYREGASVSPAGAVEAEPADKKKEQKAKEKKSRRGLRKKLPVGRIIAGVIALVIASLVLHAVLTPTPVPINYLSATPLASPELRTTVDVTGNIESETKSRVYSTLLYPINEVAVEEGDIVEEGQLLCRLDTDALEAEIKAKEAGIYTTSGNNTLSLSQAQEAYDTAVAYYEDDRDEGILSARSTVENAERTLRSAQFDVRTANQNLRDAKDADEEPSDSEMSSLRDSAAKADLQLDSAIAALERADEQLERAEEEALRTLQQLEEDVERARNNANQTADYISLDSLREDLEKCTVLAPSAGTVTAVYAEEGDAGDKLLFVIEDPDALIVESSVGEYDINNVKVGQKVELKSDATGDEIFMGEVKFVSSSSLKDAAGMTVAGATASFSLQIRVTGKSTGLKIGMNIRASVITAEKSGVTAVFYDAVGSHPETGDPVVFVAEPIARETDGGGKAAGEDAALATHTVRMVPVTTGMETDLYWEIASDQLKEGDLIMDSAADLTDGMEVHIAAAVGDMAALGADSMAGGPGGPGGRGGMAVRVGG